MVKQISDNEIYLLIKYIKSVLWRVVKHLSYIEYAECLKVNVPPNNNRYGSFIHLNCQCFHGLDVSFANPVFIYLISNIEKGNP